MRSGPTAKRKIICKVCGKSIIWRKVACICFGEPKAWMLIDGSDCILRDKPEPLCLVHIAPNGGQREQSGCKEQSISKIKH